MLKILLVEDHKIVRNGIRLLLESQEGFIVIGEAGNGREALDLIEQGNLPDVVLTDINMPEMDGITLIKILKADHPKIKSIVLSMLDNEKYILQAFTEGSQGYLLKTVNAEEMVFAIKTVLSGTKYLGTDLTETWIERMLKGIPFKTGRVSDIEFSMREMEVLHLIAEGYTNLQMADKLFLSKRTVEGHRQMLIDKTNSKNTAALIRFAVETGYLS